MRTHNKIIIKFLFIIKALTGFGSFLPFGHVFESFISVPNINSHLVFGKHQNWFNIEFTHCKKTYRARTVTQQVLSCTGTEKSELKIEIPFFVRYLFPNPQEYKMKTYQENSDVYPDCNFH